MDTARIAAIALIVVGALALGYGGFTITQDRHALSLGSLEVSVLEKRRINVPIWAGVLLVGLGGGLLLFASRGR